MLNQALQIQYDMEGIAHSSYYIKGKEKRVCLSSLLQATRSCTTLNCRLLAGQYTQAFSRCTTINYTLLVPRIDQTSGLQYQIKSAGPR
jgi:hypothetical protein